MVAKLMMAPQTSPEPGWNAANGLPINQEDCMAESTFQILGHACMLVKRVTTSLIVDPWLVGSCYWRSWWNFPPAHINDVDLAEVGYVVLSHIHWDHWHGPTIKKYLKDKVFIIPDETGTRSERDLRSLGVKRIIRAKHGKAIDLGNGVHLTCYLFGFHLNDAAIVITTPEVKLLNVNDAKIAGRPLRNIMERHGNFDFAFRSHSSANARVCFSVNDDPDQRQDDDLHYARSFELFMHAVKPRYAIPFASNHCHLHQDTFHYNEIVTNPLRLRQQLEAFGGLVHSELKVMLPGSTWSSDMGFTLAPEDVFQDVGQSLAAYLRSVQPTLDKYYEKEESVEINEKLFFRFFTLLDKTPVWHRYKMRQFRAVFEFYFPSGRTEHYLIEPFSKTVRRVTETLADIEPIRMRFPAIVFRDSVFLNMFTHALISKRCRFTAQTASGMAKIHAFLAVLIKAELELYPLSRTYLARWALGYIARWRELTVYIDAGWRLFVQRKPGYQVEEEILKGMNRRRLSGDAASTA
jgi:UDP-MurNAc hydroxylase